jgi:hypothetical protein
MPAPHPNFTEPQLRQLAQFFFDGFSNQDIAFYFDLSPTFIKDVRDGTRLPRIKKAVMEMKTRYIAMIRDGQSKGWARIAWFLERRWPKEFARPEVQLSLSESHTTNNTLVVSAEVAEALLKRSKAINQEVDALLQAKRPTP